MKWISRLPWAALQRIDEIERQNALLAAIVASSKDAIASITLDGIFTSWNPSAERLFGFSADEIIGQPFWVIVPSERANEVPDIERKISNSQPIVNHETVRLRKDGSTVAVSINISPIYDLTGAISSVSAIYRDITEQKEFEARNALLASVVASSSDAIASITLDGIFTSWNPAAERIFGFSADEMIGQPISVRIPSVNADEAANILGKISNSQPIVNYETVRLRKDGSTVPVSLTISPIYDLTGALIGGSSITRDLTDRNKAEQKFRDILESSPDAMVIIDKTGIIAIVNSQAEKVFGYRRDEMLGQPVELLLPSRFHADWPGELERFFVNPLVRPMGSGGELYGRRKDGRGFPVEVNLSPIETVDGILVVSTIRDVTDRMQLIRRLEEMNELRNEFVAIVAHDLRSPMTSISGYAQELLNEWDATDDAKKIEHLQVIVRNTEHLAGFVEDVLQVARIEAHEHTYDIGAFDIRSLVERALGEVDGANIDRRFEFSALGDIPLVLGDESRQWQVLTNLLSNAVKFSPAEEPIVVGLSRIDDSVQVSVTDRGIGIANDDLAKLFQKFGRVSNPGVLKTPGNGLGLYICKTLVEAQGGRIWCESSPGRGSTFNFTIPVAL